uniref:ANK_REP_REGION domain-containing protein n=1 Tax=Macrostomum lignano TaxID=282301 RepID=A0A1I8F3K7_9PLAT
EYFYVQKILTAMTNVEPASSRQPAEYVVGTVQRSERDWLRMQDKNGWYHALCPCCARSRPESGAPDRQWHRALLLAEDHRLTVGAALVDALGESSSADDRESKRESGCSWPPGRGHEDAMKGSSALCQQLPLRPRRATRRSCRSLQRHVAEVARLKDAAAQLVSHLGGVDQAVGTGNICLLHAVATDSREAEVFRPLTSLSVAASTKQPRSEAGNWRSVAAIGQIDKTDRPDADYVLFYAKLLGGRLLHFEAHLPARLREDGHRAGPDDRKVLDGLWWGCCAPAAQNGSATRRRRGASKAAYRTFYWAFRASDAALMSEAEFVQLRLPLKDHAGNPMATGDRLVEHWGCGSACCSAEAADGDCDQEQPLDDKRHDFITAPFVHSKRHMFFAGAASPLLEKPDAAAADGFEDGLEAKKAAPAGVSIALTEAQRIYLTHSLLHRMDMRKELRRVLGPHPGAELCAVDCIYCRRLKRRIIRNEPIVLEHLLDARIFADGFAMHEDSEPDWLRASRKGNSCASGCCLCGCCGRSDNAAVSPEDAASTQELPRARAAAPRGGTPQGNRTRGLRRRHP